MLAVNASVTLTNVNVPVPANQPFGTNYIIAVCGFSISEVTKANNTNSTLLIVTH